MKPIDELFYEAQQELLHKSLADIERETAYKWAARAGAAYGLYVAHGDVRWRLEAASYANEAIEHGALADNTGETVRAIRVWLGLRIPRGGI